jgi:hypothetical protein
MEHEDGYLRLLFASVMSDVIALRYNATRDHNDDEVAAKLA